MELRVLRYFIEVAREQNITAAAERLYITQSTLSKQLMELEAELGKQLLVRGKRKTTLTEDGMFLFRRAQEIVDLADMTQAALMGTDEAVTADHLARVNTIPLDEVELAELLTGLPGGSKVAGSAIGTLCEGTFQLNGIGLCKVCVNTGQTLFVRVDTDDTAYVLSGNSAEESRALYEQITAALS